MEAHFMCTRRLTRLKAPISFVVSIYFLEILPENVSDKYETQNTNLNFEFHPNSLKTSLF